MAKDKKQNREGGRAVSPSASKKSKRAPKAKRKQKWAMSRDERKANRRGVVLRIVACVLLLVITFLMAIIVGTSEYKPSPVGWIPFIAAVACIVIAFIYLQLLKRSLKLAEVTNVTDCRRDEEVHFKVRFKNTSLLFFFRMEAHFFTSDLLGKPVSHAATTIALAPFESYVMPFTAKFDHIGTYKAGLDRVVVYDFLRLFSVTIPGPKQVNIQVTPKLVAVPRIEYSNDAVVETTKAARSALSDSMDYAAVREYVIGDPMKNVHWKLSARSAGDELYTKMFEVYTNPGVAILLDFYGPGAGAIELMDMFDAVVESGFSIARDAQRRGMDAEVHYTDKTGVREHIIQWRESDLPQIVSDMPAFSADPSRAHDAIELLEEQINSIHGQSNIVVCSANLSARMIETVISAKMHRREPIFIAVVPQGLEGRERDQWLASLGRLDTAGVTYKILCTSDDLVKGVK